MNVSNLFFYKILFAAEILVAEFLFTFRLKKRSFFSIRFIACAVVLFAVAAVFPRPAFITEPTAAAWYSSLTFLCIFALTIPMLVFCYKEPPVNAVFCAIAAYTLQHFAYEFANLVLTLIVWGRSPLLGVYSPDKIDMFAFDKISLFYALIYIFCYFTSYVAVYYLFCKRIGKSTDMRIKSLSLLLLIGAGLLVNILLHSFIIYKEYDNVSVIVDCIYNLLCCILLLSGQFALLSQKELKGELDVVQRMWHEEKEQFILLKENMDIIDMKCHDMRHQIREIGEGKRLPSDVIDEIEKSVNVYDSVIKTGNEALDVILTEKSLRANAGGILLSCMADGRALDFIKEADLYSLFGNALDNAIEAVMKIADKDKRVISLNVAAKGDFVSVCVKNSFDGNLTLNAEGLPITTKDDPAYHGYGLKSMNYIVEKYNGNLSFTVKEGLFRLNVLLPKS